MNSIRVGGIPPGLIPEKSNTTTIGLLYRPSLDHSFSVTHWETNFRDRVFYIDPQTLVDNERFFPERVIRNPASGLVTLLDLRQINMSRYDSAGVDISIDSYLPTGVGDFSAGLSATYTYKHESQLTDSSPVVDNVSMRRDDGWAPRWKVVPRVGWKPRSGLNFMVAGRYVSRYQDTRAFSTGENAGQFPQLGDTWIVDVNADIDLSRWLNRFRALRENRLSLGATNVLNEVPDFCNGCGIRGYDSSIYDIVGRTYYAEMRFNF